AFEALFGKRPFAGDTIEAITAAVVYGKLVETYANVPRWLRAAIVRGLAADPEQRWPSIGALCDELERRQQRARRGLIAGGLALAGVAGTAIAWVALPAKAAPPTPCDASVSPAIWSEDRADKLARKLPRSTVLRAKEWLQRWSLTATEVCLTIDRDTEV